MAFQPTGQEIYQLVSFDSRDTSQVQIYLRTINNALYFNTTYINPEDLGWFQSIIETDIIYFFQNGQQVASAKVLAPLDDENGYRIEKAPSLVEGQIYELAFSRPPPADSVHDLRGEKGWSPVIDYEAYDGGIVFKYIDWLAGEGTKPQIGYLGPRGLVSNIANATKLNLPAGTKWTSGDTLPATPKTNDFHLFSTAGSSLANYYEADGTTAKTSAVAGEIARFDTDKWIYVMTLSASGTETGTRKDIDLGVFENANGGAIAGHYVRISATQVDISHRNIANEDKSTEINAIPAGFGLVFGGGKIFVAEWFNNNSGYRSINGFWVGGEPDTTAESSQISIKVRQQELRMIRFITKEQVYKLIPDLKAAIDKTVDIHLEENPGDFANMNDATVAGIALIENTAANRAALDARTFNFAGLTWQNTTVDIPNDGKDYWVVVRVALELGHIETQFQLIDDDPLEGTEYLRRSRQEDANWRYYQVTADTESIWTLQRRAATHTNWLGRIGTAALLQVQTTINDTINGLRKLLLPDPATGSVGQIPKITSNNNVKSWSIGDDERGSSSGSGLTTAQEAKLDAIPNLPDEDKRNLKGLLFKGNALAWELFDFLTRSEFRDYKPHTPERGDTLPVHLLPQGTFILQKTSHWSDKFYRFYPVWRNINLNGQTHRDIGTIEVPLSSEWTVFESTDNANPAIFSATRVAGMVYRQTEGPTIGYRWYPKIILDRALFPQDQGAYDYSGLSIRMRTDFGSHFDAQLFKVSFDADDSNGSVNEIVAGGKTYVCFRPNPNAVDARIIFDNVVTNDTWLSFQILKSKSASPVFPPTDPQFLSDDPSTPWVDGDEFETGLYEGDANGHPQARILPPIDLWDHVVARSNTYFSGSNPDARAGVDGQFWANLRNGQIHQKQSGTWTLITDLALQTEISRAIDWSSIPNNTAIPANFITKHSNRYFGAKAAHQKTSGSTAPTGDATNWIELSNEATTGSSAVTLVWADIPNNQSITIGTLVNHGGNTYACITTHNKVATGPDGDPTNWQLLSTYQALWSAKHYLAGSIVVRGAGIYVSLHNVNSTDPAPDASNNVKWLQINNVEPQAVFAELGINANIDVPQIGSSAIPLTYLSALNRSHNAGSIIARASAGNGITLKAGSYVIDVDMNVDTETSGENARTNIEFTVYNGSTLIATKRSGYVRSLNTFNEQVVTTRFTLDFGSDSTIQIRVKMHDNDTGTPTISTQTGGSVVVRRIGA